MNIQHESPRVLLPGLSRITAGTERYEVPAIGAIVIGLEAGDCLLVEDIEGQQPVELAAFTKDGDCAIGTLGLTENSHGEGISAILGGSSYSAQKVRFGLEIRGLSINNLKTHTISDCFAENQLSATAMEDCICIVAAPGQAMLVYEQNAPTGLKAKILRKNPLPVNEKPLPDPLADPVFEQRIAARTAQSFTVRAGDYIQILDVAGRECSDFQAFSIKELEKGNQLPIDITGTRTLMGHGYPLPGLHSKYLDANHDPLIEVIQDTVGRHDTFGYACTAKYYEDQGYFGHSNCSENFNHALAKHGIHPRKGWEAVNFFYNTGIDDHNVLYLDEPWSRPGDYVLLQALTDLVCVSSACPDDTTAANAWNPTDIHVRVYAEKSPFKRAIAFRRKPEDEMKLTEETGFHEETSKLTRNFIEYKCYWLASHYNNFGKQAEYYACRDQVAVIDLSALRKFEIMGEDAEELLQWTLTRNVKKLAQGQIVYSAMCYEHGGMFDDGTLLRLGDNQYRWIGGSELGGDWLREQAKARGLEQVTVKSSTDQIHNIAVQGPRSREVLKKIVWTAPQYSNMDELGWFRFSVGRLHGPQGIPLMISRTGYTGELGYEVWCHPQHASEVWNTVFAAGEEFSIAPLGLDALDMLRIESGLIFADYEFTEETDPFEAGIGFTVPLKSKEDDFLGKDALIRRKANPMRKLVGLELMGNEVAAHGDCVHVGRPQIGVITSGTRSPKLGKNIALCRIDVTHADIGTEVEIGKLDGHQKRLPAKVVAFPFYDPDKSRVRA